jgi:hypothetical protein
LKNTTFNAEKRVKEDNEAASWKVLEDMEESIQVVAI